MPTDLTEAQRKAVTALFVNAVSQANQLPAYSQQQYAALEVAYNALDTLRQGGQTIRFAHTPVKHGNLDLVFDARDDVKQPSQIIRALSQVLCNHHVGTTLPTAAVEAGELFHHVRHDAGVTLTNRRDATRFVVGAVMVAKMEPAGSKGQQHAMQLAEQVLNGMEDQTGLHLFHGQIIIGKASMYFDRTDEMRSNRDIIASISTLVDDYVGLGHALSTRELPAPPRQAPARTR